MEQEKKPMGTTIKVLLVEDNEADANLTRETLESGKLHVKIDVAIDGIQALEKLRSASPLPDLVLLDLNLPKMDGRQVLSEMKNDAKLKCIPVVILSSSDAEIDVVKSYQLGANCYVTKPVGLKSFQKIVRSVEDFWFTVVKLP
jgi:CheY-like chemotaxis protein